LPRVVARLSPSRPARSGCSRDGGVDEPAYLLIILAVLGRPDWFFWAAAFGTCVYRCAGVDLPLLTRRSLLTHLKPIGSLGAAPGAPRSSRRVRPPGSRKLLAGQDRIRDPSCHWW
jgi:hypothetical protein